MIRRLAAWWLRHWLPEFCWPCDKRTWLHHSHVAHPNRPGRSR